jgi:hypothetical protein
VFLWPYREETSWMEVQLAAMQTQINVKRFAINTSIERQSRSIEEKVRSVREPLEAKGVVVECHRGSLRNGIAAVRDSGIETVVLCRNHRVTLGIVIARLRKMFRLPSSSNAEPILYLRPTGSIDWPHFGRSNGPHTF